MKWAQLKNTLLLECGAGLKSPPTTWMVVKIRQVVPDNWWIPWNNGSLVSVKIVHEAAHSNAVMVPYRVICLCVNVSKNDSY